MFHAFATRISRHWVWVLLIWALLLAGFHAWAPRWDAVTHDGDFAYLPGEMSSVQGEKLLRAAFPEVLAKSKIALVLARSDGKLRREDFAVADWLIDRFASTASDDSPIVEVTSYHSPVIGRKLLSRPSAEGQATFIVLKLRNEFMAVDNMALMERIEETLAACRAAESFPAGLQVEVTGSAAVGADMLFSAKESIDNTERATIALVLLILLLVYRAPGLVLVPLTAIVASTILAMDLVAVLASWSPRLDWLDFKIFKTTRIFIVVILFGAGTDYCLFLIARYREELEHGRGCAEAVAYALSKAGRALAGSALTTIVGLGMMVFADFGKFRNSGPAIALCLTVALIACITLAPALLRAMGSRVFWPWKIHSLRQRFVDTSGVFGGFWHWLSRIVLARPGLVLLAAVVVMTPLAYEGLSVPLTYDLLSELRADRPSVRGTRLMQRHFGPSEIDPVTLLVHQRGAAIDSDPGRHQIALLTNELYQFTYVDSRGQTVRPVRGVRSLTEPLGNPPGSFNLLSRSVRDKIFVLKNPRTKRYYCSEAPRYDGEVARFDLVFQYDPFSSESIRLLDHIEQFLQTKAEPRASAWNGARFLFTGTTAGIRDLETVTHRDQVRIQVLVVVAVFGILLMILRRPGICLYLILSVLLGYFVTIGTTELFFGWYYGPTYHGLDWKVPIFLFVILVAVGEDYNIYLVTRVFEEQSHRGMAEGLATALVRTGGIITSCGVIMAGTFASMMTGTLRAMHELGFALSLGVLLDTFIIRTVLVPAFLALTARWRGTDP